MQEGYLKRRNTRLTQLAAFSLLFLLIGGYRVAGADPSVEGDGINIATDQIPESVEILEQAVNAPSALAEIPDQVENLPPIQAETLEPAESVTSPQAEAPDQPEGTQPVQVETQEQAGDTPPSQVENVDKIESVPSPEIETPGQSEEKPT